MTEVTIYDHLSLIQTELNAPKNRNNSFGKFKYRHYEDIVSAIKKLMPQGCVLLLSDNIVAHGDRFYIHALATFAYKDKIISTSGFAREALEKKGCDAAQITGGASSYARKYALCGLFAIDSNDEDIDEQDHSGNGADQSASNYSYSQKISPSQVRVIADLSVKAGVDIGKILKEYDIQNITHLETSAYESVIKRLNITISKQPKPEDYLKV